jgi:hypothetical protein
MHSQSERVECWGGGFSKSLKRTAVYMAKLLSLTLPASDPFPPNGEPLFSAD